MADTRKIVAFKAENIKRLSVVEIKPTGNLVQITGRNGSGKSSVLDSILWAMCGEKQVQWVPIRKGQERATIRLDLGDYVVTRTFRHHAADGDKEAKTTTQLFVESPDGARFQQPQKLLDSWSDSLSFDPLAFTRMKPADQFNALKKFVPDVDFDAIEAANKKDYAERTEVNRDAKRTRAAAESITVPADLPAAPIDEAALTREFGAAGEHNANVDRMGERNLLVANDIDRLVDELASLDATEAPAIAQIEANANGLIAEYERQIEDLRTKIETEQTRIITRTAEHKAAVAKRREAKTQELAGRRETLDAIPPLPEKKDADVLWTKIEAARATNAGLARKAERDRGIKAAQELEAKSAALTKAIDDRDAAKQKAIADAKLPLPGITFGDGMILLAGVPFDQASDAEQLRASVAIAMAGKPKLRVIRVRDGSLLDEQGLEMLAKMADEFDCQVWAEIVANDATTGFVLEDGHLKDAAPAEAEKPAPAAVQGGLL